MASSVRTIMGGKEHQQQQQQQSEYSVDAHIHLHKAKRERKKNPQLCGATQNSQFFVTHVATAKYDVTDDALQLHGGS
jgi:hypothetical protein